MGAHRISDPQGLLFYYHAGDFRNIINKKIIYQVYYNNEKTKAIKVDFLRDENSGPVATVGLIYRLFYDFGLTVFAAGVVPRKGWCASYFKKIHIYWSGKQIGIPSQDLHNGQGQWQDLKIGTTSAEIGKLTNETTITLTMESIKKKAFFDMSDNFGRRSICE